MPTPAMVHRDLIDLFQGLLYLCQEAPGADGLFALERIIAELELQEMYGTEVSLRDCARIIAGISASGRAYHDGPIEGTGPVLSA